MSTKITNRNRSWISCKLPRLRPASLRPASLRPASLRPASLRPASLRPPSARPLDASMIPAAPSARYSPMYSRQRQIIVEDPGFGEDLVAYSAPNPPRSPKVPRSF
jgi:hypothetical protein